jgi:DNA-directed RNA polymerase
VRPKLRKYDVAFLSVRPEKLALITLRVLLNALARTSSRRHNSLSATAREIGRACARERMLDVRFRREVDLPKLLLSRNRSANAKARARKLSRGADDDWAESDIGIKLGMDLIGLAVKNCLIEAQPAFEFATSATGPLLHYAEVGSTRTGSAQKKRTVIRLTLPGFELLADRLAIHERLASPLQLPMVTTPRPWTDLTGGGYPSLGSGEWQCFGESRVSLQVG